jgi:hypothetical protein
VRLPAGDRGEPGGVRARRGRVRRGQADVRGAPVGHGGRDGRGHGGADDRLLHAGHAPVPQGGAQGRGRGRRHVAAPGAAEPAHRLQRLLVLAPPPRHRVRAPARARLLPLPRPEVVREDGTYVHPPIDPFPQLCVMWIAIWSRRVFFSLPSVPWHALDRFHCLGEVSWALLVATRRVAFFLGG